MQRHFALYKVSGEHSFWDWFWFSVDKTYLKALPDWGFLGDFHPGGIRYAEPAGGYERYVMTGAWLLLYYVLVQALFRAWEIRPEKIHPVLEELEPLLPKPPEAAS